MDQVDNGAEISNIEFNHFFQVNGIKRKLTVPCTAEQNVVAEQKNHTLLWCMMALSKFPPSFELKQFQL